VESLADPLVDATPIVPGLVLDLRYATLRNPFHEAVYDAAVFALRRSVALRLADAARALESRRLRLVAFDGYRPLSVQRRLWEICPVPGYVASPERGSNHNRGTAVDVGLADAGGTLLELPTDHDDFGEAAHHGFAGCSAAAVANRELLLRVMRDAGFTENSKEWWHYDAPGAGEHEVLDVPLSSLRGRA
jgi:D-alanyl-D-alanine dipeptidase